MSLPLAAGVGLALGFLGTLIGAGGGFLLVPLLVLIAPAWQTETVTAFSLAVVAANASSGATSYWRAGRVDVRSFVQFALAAIPGSLIGAYASAFIPRRVFDPVFGGVLVAIAAVLFLRAGVRRLPHDGAPGRARRALTDRHGMHYVWSFDPRVGIAGSAGVGFLSSILGIGGGIVHVPLLVTLLNFPEHVATATSHAVLAVTALAGTLIHLLHGDYRDDWPAVLACAGAAVVGAPLGARASRHVPGRVILRILATGLAFVGLRLLAAR